MKKKTYTPAGIVLTQLVLETFRLNGSLLAVGDKFTAHKGLTSARWQVLGAIVAEGAPSTVPNIARNMGLQRQRVQRIVDILETEGLVEFEENPHHKRAKLVALTAEGRAAHNDIMQDQIPWINEIAEGAEMHEIENALLFLRKMRERLKDFGSDT